jgi:23S rRNA pseudouridine1911/1915/1917 synthase
VKRGSKNKRGRPTRTPDDLNLLFEDDDIIVVDKPAGLLTIATEKEKHETAFAILFEYVKSKHPVEKLFIVHRLDRDASGLLVFAKSEEAKYALQEQFKDHSAGRTYLAVIVGKFEKEKETIESYLAENSIYRSYSTTDRTKGKRAVTHITVVKRAQHRTLIEVRLETGRKHQIRVHLAERGHTILGDKSYGSTSNPIGRLCLHATRLVFEHPLQKKTMTFNSPMPAEFHRLV